MGKRAGDNSKSLKLERNVVMHNLTPRKFVLRCKNYIPVNFERDMRIYGAGLVAGRALIEPDRGPREFAREQKWCAAA